jgi:hypothetical protein
VNALAARRAAVSEGDFVSLLQRIHSPERKACTLPHARSAHPPSIPVTRITTNMADLEHAILLAAQAHRGQRDKAGAPYILHPLRMMLRMQTDAEKMTAVLHDVVEDTPWTLEGLRAEGFPEEVLEAVDHLTQREGESYDDFTRRAASHPVARRVKIADLEDNMDVRRIANVTEWDAERLTKYHRTWRALVSGAE